jgi:hypothetical protein
MEEWKPVAGFPGYRVSSMGRVESLSYRGTGVARLMNPTIHDFGYRYYRLNGGARRYAHRLVAEAFLPNPDGLPQVDHINRNPADDRLSNLRWVSCSTNALNTKQRASKTGERNIKQRPDGFAVHIQRNNQLVFRKWFKTLAEAVKARDEFLCGE